MKRPNITLLACLLLGLTMIGCNPFSDERGALGQDCFENNTCNSGLICYQNTCHVPADCSQPDEIDCSLPGGPEQGLDEDEDGWGKCCDCNDVHPDDFPGASEACDGRDNDCDDLTDEDQVCPSCMDEDGDLYGLHCPLGDDCDDSDGDIHPNAPETCDGRDEDCDGATDEDLPDRACPLDQGVCAGALQRCDPETGWTACDYGPDYTLGPDETCDGLDNDCDAETDEDSTTDAPEVGPLATDGIDNNCNGLIDEPGGAMVPLPNMPAIWVDTYESAIFENADCTGAIYGQGVDDYPAAWPPVGDESVSLYACSLPGILPSGHLSWFRAQRACRAQGKRLCNELEIKAACHGGTNTSYPYGFEFIAGVCNDALGGSGTAEATGSRQQCTSPAGTFDMSGNMAEWTSHESGATPGTFLMGGHCYEDILCQNGIDCTSSAAIGDADHLIIMVSTCSTYDNPRRRFLPEQAWAWFGTRCCFDAP